MPITRIPKVSVVVPNYNHARFLRRRVDSILAQTFQDFELILLDDCSIDDSRAILSQYANDPRVRIEFNDVNSGTPFKQWNKGVALAQAEYVWVAESDDYAAPTFLERLCAALDAKPEAAFAYCRSWHVSHDDQVDGFAYPPLGAEPKSARWTSDYCLDGMELSNDFVRCNIVQNASAVLFRKGIYKFVGGADENLHLSGDWKLWAAMAMTGKIAYVSEPLNYYRFHSANVRNATQRDGTELRELRVVRWWILDHVTRPGAPKTDAQVKRELTDRCLEHAYMNYPACPDIYRVALQRARNLAGLKRTPRFNTWKGELLKHLIGWKATRRAQLLYHECVKRARWTVGRQGIASASASRQANI